MGRFLERSPIGSLGWGGVSFWLAYAGCLVAIYIAIVHVEGAVPIVVDAASLPYDDRCSLSDMSKNVPPSGPWEMGTDSTCDALTYCREADGRAVHATAHTGQYRADGNVGSLGRGAISF